MSDDALTSYVTLTVATYWWARDGSTIKVDTLIDTGCGTSLVTTGLLDSVTDRSGAFVRQRRALEPIGLVSASGGKLWAESHLHTRQHPSHTPCVCDASFALSVDFGHGLHSNQQSLTLVHPRHRHH